MKVILRFIFTIIFFNFFLSCSVPPGSVDKKRCKPGKSYSEITKECEDTGSNS